MHARLCLYVEANRMRTYEIQRLKNAYRFQCDSDRDLIWLEWSEYQHRVNETVGALNAWVVRGAT